MPEHAVDGLSRGWRRGQSRERHARIRRHEPIDVRLLPENVETDLRIERGADIRTGILEPHHAAEAYISAARNVVAKRRGILNTDGVRADRPHGYCSGA